MSSSLFLPKLATNLNLDFLDDFSYKRVHLTLIGLYILICFFTQSSLFSSFSFYCFLACRAFRIISVFFLMYDFLQQVTLDGALLWHNREYNVEHRFWKILNIWDFYDVIMTSHPWISRRKGESNLGTHLFPLIKWLIPGTQVTYQRKKYFDPPVWRWRHTMMSTSFALAYLFMNKWTVKFCI